MLDVIHDGLFKIGIENNRLHASWLLALNLDPADTPSMLLIDTDGIVSLLHRVDYGFLDELFQNGGT